MIEIRVLGEDDDRGGFRSGDDDLDRFFHRFAGQNQFRHHLGVTYVAVEEGRILGYATVAPGHLEIDDLPPPERRALPRYPLPVLRLARLAVDRSARGLGLGAQLLRFVLELAVQMSQEFGCVGVVVDAKPGAEGFYERFGFVSLGLLEGMSEARPSPLPMYVSLRAIQKAWGR